MQQDYVFESLQNSPNHMSCDTHGNNFQDITNHENRNGPLRKKILWSNYPTWVVTYEEFLLQAGKL